MRTYVLRQLAGVVPLLLVAVFVVFLFLHLAPGDPVAMMMPENASPAELEAAREQLGLTQPLPAQFLDFVTGLVRLDLGDSLRYSQPVVELIGGRAAATLELALASLIVSIVIGIPLGVVAAMKRNTWIDRVASAAGLVGMSVPNFWLGLLLIIYVGGMTGWFPTGGRVPMHIPMEGPTGFLVLDAILNGRMGDLPTILSHLALPAVTLGASAAGIVMRMTRSSMIEVMGEDYVRTARAKGVRPDAVTTRHILRNALLPVSTVLGLELSSLLSGSIVVETVFAWPGLGELLVTAVGVRDYPLVQGIVVVFAVIFILVNLLTDVSYAVIDPRIRYD